VSRFCSASLSVRQSVSQCASVAIGIAVSYCFIPYELVLYHYYSLEQSATHTLLDTHLEMQPGLLFLNCLHKKVAKINKLLLVFCVSSLSSSSSPSLLSHIHRTVVCRSPPLTMTSHKRGDPPATTDPFTPSLPEDRIIFGKYPIDQLLLLVETVWTHVQSTNSNAPLDWSLISAQLPWPAIECQALWRRVAYAWDDNSALVCRVTHCREPLHLCKPWIGD
jgi:hypothetical protein